VHRSPLRVAIDVSSAVDPRPTGIARTITGLVTGLQAHPGVELTLLCRSSRWRRARPTALFPGLPVRRWLDLGTPRGVDLLHSPDLRVPRRCRVPLVVTVHDLSALERSDHASSRFIAKKRARLDRAGRSADALLTSCASVRDDLIERLGLPPERVTAVPLWPGLPRGETPTLPPDSPARRELLLVGGPSRRKRSDWIAGFLPRWDRLTGLTEERVLWCGSAAESEARAFLASLPREIAARIDWLGHITDAELDRLLGRARAFLQLSDTEGFGIPLLEAAMRDCPIIATRCATAEEVLPADAVLWLDGEAGERGLEDWGSPEDRRARGERARAAAGRYTREMTVEGTLAIYRRVLSSSGASASAG
jgi:glycosyltransferase involved in cell wall biosynthesis